MRSTDRNYLNIIENPEDLVVITDSEYQIIYANRSYCDTFGVPFSDLEGTMLFANVLSDDIESVKAKLAGLSQDSSAANFEERIIIDERTIWLDWNVKGLFSDDGRLRELVGTGRNITECKVNENVLNLFKYSLMYAHIGTFWLNKDHEMLYVNDYGCKMLGFSREQLINFDWERLIPEEYLETKAEFWEKQKREKFQDFDIELIRKSGERFPAGLMMHHQEFAGEEYEFVFIQDLSDRNLLLQKLQDNERQFRSLFENSPVSLWEEDFSDLKQYLDSLPKEDSRDLRSFFDNNLQELYKCVDMVKIVQVNKKTLQIFEASSNEEFMISLNKIFCEETLPTVKDEICSLYEKGTSYIMETEEKTLTGRVINVELTVNIAPGYEDSWEKVYVSIIDITDRKRVENELRQHRDKLAELVEEKTAEIQKKYNELNHQFSVMVTREFRIKELRDEIKELKEKLIIFEEMH
ncbi:MAG: PAS domain S-box protein [Candidatus Cloacimonetes bacterium]|nr:PAS domain S-box protein [Candidatus Cloacimonadota bacterium]